MRQKLKVGLRAMPAIVVLSLGCVFAVETAAMAAPPVSIVSVSFEEGLAAAKSHPDPVYSAIARQLKLRGRVEVTAFVDTEGKVFDTVIVVGNPVLTALAVEAIQKWEFKPFVDDDGKPAKGMVHIRFDMAPPAADHAVAAK